MKSKSVVAGVILVSVIVFLSAIIPGGDTHAPEWYCADLWVSEEESRLTDQIVTSIEARDQYLSVPGWDCVAI